MTRNLGHTKLRKRKRQEDPMREFDRLPPPLRAWLSSAALPWRPESVRRAYNRALSQCGSHAGAIDELNRMQAAKLAKDAFHV